MEQVTFAAVREPQYSQIISIGIMNLMDEPFLRSLMRIF
jgi:hypothetical protein